MARTRQSAAEELDALHRMTTAELRQQWQGRFGKPPPQLRRPLLLAALAYEAQQQVLGGLSRRTQRALERRVMQAASPAAPRPHLPVGTRLVRQWQGHNHAVDVTGDGFVWRDQHFDSLSAVARAITGTRWSGPRFFGLNQSNGDSTP